MIGIRQEGKIQFVLVAEFLVAGRVVGTHPQHNRAHFLECRLGIAKCARLFGTTGSIIFGIKVKHNRFPGKIAQANLAAIIGNKGQRGGLLARL